mgnify:CR=1 FL=1
MCGIVGCILKEDRDVAPILFDCISKLEYRGYDSIGLAHDAVHSLRMALVADVMPFHASGFAILFFMAYSTFHQLVIFQIFQR